MRIDHDRSVCPAAPSRPSYIEPRAQAARVGAPAPVALTMSSGAQLLGVLRQRLLALPETEGAVRAPVMNPEALEETTEALLSAGVLHPLKEE